MIVTAATTPKSRTALRTIAITAFRRREPGGSGGSGAVGSIGGTGGTGADVQVGVPGGG